MAETQLKNVTLDQKLKWKWPKMVYNYKKKYNEIKTRRQRPNESQQEGNAQMSKKKVW